MHLQREIAQQPALLERLLKDGRADTERVASAIREFDPAFVCLAARGTSDNAARYAQYLFGALLGLPALRATPSLHTLYRRPPDLSRALVIGVSQSGRAEDARAVIMDANQQGALTLAITNYADSPLAQAARHHLPLRAEPELSVAATKTYTAQLAVFAMLTTALAADESLGAQLALLPQMAREALQRSDSIAAWAERYRYADRLTSLGRGFNFATAHEISLKLKELCYIASDAYSEANFRHGPIAAIDRGQPVILVAPRGASLAGMADICERLEELGAETLVISDDDAMLALGTRAMPVPSTPEWLSPIVCVMPGQVFALRQAIARGHDVDKPRGLSKVTITR